MPPLQLLIKPASGQCSLRCRYRFYADGAKNRKTGSCGTMSEKTLKIIVRKAFLQAGGTVSFGFQGGEPTLCGAGCLPGRT